MQPTNHPRPVMDVTARHKPVTPPVERPSAPLPVREAPARPEELQGRFEVPKAAPQTLPSAAALPASESSLPLESQPTTAPSTPAKPTAATPPTPVGAIVATIFSMLILAGIAVLVYLKS